MYSRPSTRKRMTTLRRKCSTARSAVTRTRRGSCTSLTSRHRGRGRVGAGEEEDDCVGDTERMVAALRSRAYPSLEIDLEILPGEFHETAPPLNLSRSIRSCSTHPGNWARGRRGRDGCALRGE